MRRFLVLLALALPLLPGRGRAADRGDVDLAFSLYAAGFNTADLTARVHIDPDGYRVTLSFHTVGLADTFFSGHQTTTVTGRWRGSLPAPIRMEADGVWHGEVHRTVIDYVDGQPVVRVLVPPLEADREAVPEAARHDTIDTLSGLAMLLHDVGRGGQCDDHALMFDGRRLVDVTARTAGSVAVATSGRSPYAGQALRCDFEGRLLAGFKTDEGMAAQRRPRKGAAWLAPVLPGTLPLPIRISFETNWFGDATMYLTAATPLPR